MKDFFRLHEINCNNSKNLLFVFFCKMKKMFSIFQGKVSRYFFNINFPILIFLFDLMLICNQAIIYFDKR
jgi:hypothetical protein